MKIGYVRVSTVEQNVARQIEQMKKLQVEKIFLEKISGKNIKDRIELKKMLKFAKKGDIIYIHDFSRLARSTKDLLEIVEFLNKKNINLISFKENIDFNTATGKLMLTLIGAINEFERFNLLERQKEGILIAKKLGKYKGRKPISFPENWEKIYKLWEKNKIKSMEAQKMLGLKKNTFYKLVKDWKKMNNLNILE